MSGELKEACGVFGLYGDDDAPALSVMGLYALQHRGQESAGVATLDGGRVAVEKGMGLVADVFTAERMARMRGHAAVGHVRYSTTGSSNPQNAQPLLFRSRFGPLALAHNGNLVNASAVRAALEDEGAIFQTTTDTEVVAHLVARSRAESLEEALREALATLRGGYALVVLSREGVLAVRDPVGIRPLVWGRRGASGVVASESGALSAVDGELGGDVAPGTLVRLGERGVTFRDRFLSPQPERLCSFEYIYFARPDAVMDGRTVQTVRRRLGEELAREAPAPADVVIGVPDSSLAAAEGYARELGLPLEQGLAKNRYIHRTFIRPSAGERHSAMRLKLTAIEELVRGRQVALVDDSLVRGTTASHLVGLLERAGALGVHIRIASPPYLNPCYYGIDTSNRDELVAVGRNPQDIARSIGASSLAFLSPEGVGRAVGKTGCMACFTGEYPVSIAGATSKDAMEVRP